MAKEDVIWMKKREIQRASMLDRIMAGELTQKRAGEVLRLSDRQIRRIQTRYVEEGISGLAHRLRGRISSRKHKKKENILKLYWKKYYDFGPTLASEKLEERDKLLVNRETLRQWLSKEQSEHEWQRRSRPHRKWRPRKECFGEMVQMDGSHHDWLEGRGPELVLMGYVDDATGTKFGRFYAYEGTVPALDSFCQYVLEYGIPRSIYLDRHSTYKTTRNKTIFEDLMNREALTQFSRAMNELGVKVIHAHSAPAKGRVENSFRTFQDRLVKEMRLEKIRTKKDANLFLGKYLPWYNNRFSVPAQNASDLHIKRPSRYIIDKTLCMKKEQALRKNSTVHYNKRVFLITNCITNRASRVIVEERLDGSIHIKHKDQYLKHKEIAPHIKVNQKAIVQKKENKKTESKLKKNSKPAADHPWRKRPLVRYTNIRKHLTKMNEYALSKQ